MGKIFRFRCLLSALGIGIIGLTFLVPGDSYGDVSEPPDTKAEDFAGAALIASNAAISIYLGTGLKSEKTSTARGLLGIGIGTASILLGVTETTSHSSVVALTGAITLTLGALNFVGDGPPQQENEQEFDLSRKISVNPLLVKSKGEQLGLGFLVTASF